MDNKRGEGKNPRPKMCCEYTKTKLGILPGCCDMRVPYRRSFNYCPYCGRPIALLFNDRGLLWN